MPSKPESIIGARRFAAEIAVACGFSDDEVYDIKLAVSEALTNAIKHGSPYGNESIVYAVFLCDQEKIRIIVIDEGAFSYKDLGSSHESEGGRGINLISSFMDYVAIQPSANGTSVTMVKNLACREGNSRSGLPGKHRPPIPFGYQTPRKHSKPNHTML